jgi:hypothetical protein
LVCGIIIAALAKMRLENAITTVARACAVPGPFWANEASLYRTEFAAAVATNCVSVITLFHTVDVAVATTSATRLGKLNAVLVDPSTVMVGPPFARPREVPVASLV